MCVGMCTHKENEDNIMASIDCLWAYYVPGLGTGYSPCLCRTYTLAVKTDRKQTKKVMNEVISDNAEYQEENSCRVREVRGLSGDMEIFCILIVVVVTQVHLPPNQ